MPNERAETPPDEKHQRYAEIIPIKKMRMILNSSDIEFYGNDFRGSVRNDKKTCHLDRSSLERSGEI